MSVEIENTYRLNDLRQLILEKTGLQLHEQNNDKLMRAISMRVEQRKLHDFNSYYRILHAENKHSHRELEYFTNLMTTGETYFFRDKGQMALLKNIILPKLIEQGREKHMLRIWSAGCASGEEPYSLAMMLDEMLPQKKDWTLLIHGTDINSHAINKARHALYGSWSFRMTEPSLKDKYFQPHKDKWKLDERIRKMVSFDVGNLLADDFPGNHPNLYDMDLIICRNVFIYFTAEHTGQIADKLAASLRDGGYLITGHSELPVHARQKLSSKLYNEGMVYQRGTGTTVSEPPIEYIARPELKQHRQKKLPVKKAHQRKQPIEERAPVSRIPLPLASDPLAPGPLAADIEQLIVTAQALADSGDYARAEQTCQQAIDNDPLSAKAHMVYSQLAQLKGEFERASELLDKALYLDPESVPALLERAALYKRINKLERAQALHHCALKVIRALPADTVIEPYDITAAEMAKGLEM